MANKGKKLRKSEIKPFKPAKCWRKYRGGTTYYIGTNNGVDWSKPKAGESEKHPDYKLALAEWHQLESKLEFDEARGIDTSTKHYQEHLKKWRKLPDEVRSAYHLPPHLQAGLGAVEPNEEPAPYLNTALAQLQTVPAKLGPDNFTGPAHQQGGFNSAGVDSALIENAAAAYVAPPTAVSATLPTFNGDTSVSGLIESFLSSRRSKVKAKQNANKTYAELRTKLLYFQGYCEQHGIEHVSEIQAATLHQFNAEQTYWLSVPKSDGGVSATTIEKRLGMAKRFLLWAESLGACSLPRPAIDTFAAVDAQDIDPDIDGNGQENPTFEIDEIHALFSLASERTKLYILLGLNLGWTQSDISSLCSEHFNPKTGVIDRLRKKTRRKAKVRCIATLWPITKKLLLKHATKETTGPMLLTENGTELLNQRINSNGSVTEVDSIRLAFDRLRKQWAKSVLSEQSEHAHLFEHHKKHVAERNELIKQWLRADGRGFKCFRKTAADAIKKNSEFTHLRHLFLGHVESTMADKHYTNPDVEALQKAIKWLGSHFALKL